MNEISRPTEDLSREALIGDMGGNTVRLYKVGSSAAYMGKLPMLDAFSGS